MPLRHVSVPAGQTVEVPFTVDVPADADTGDYAGGVVTSLTVADQSANVNVDRRLGIRAASGWAVTSCPPSRSTTCGWTGTAAS